MNASICRTSLTAAALAGVLACGPAIAAAPQHLVTFRGRITPSPARSTSAAACPDALRAAAPTSAISAFHAPLAQPVVVVPASAFAPGQFSGQVRNATAHAQLARACAK